MNRKTLIIAAMLIPLVLFAFAVMSPDEPEFTVLEQNEAFELREYKPYVVAEAIVEGGFDEASDRAFRILVAYIQGNNLGGRNLPMTAPVKQQPIVSDGERISMTAPMTQPADANADSWLFQFVMPKEYILPMLPKPVDERVALRPVPARLVAARRYRGGWREPKYRDNELVLLDALQEAGLTPVSTPVFARYNAPFVPGFLRRNEVLVDVERQ
ncbi:MAG: heme-binding protein [Thiohalocapsa sp.]